jgi:hypothetical protein
LIHTLVKVLGSPHSRFDAFVTVTPIVCTCRSHCLLRRGLLLDSDAYLLGPITRPCWLVLLSNNNLSLVELRWRQFPCVFRVRVARRFLVVCTHMLNGLLVCLTIPSFWRAYWSDERGSSDLYVSRPPVGPNFLSVSRSEVVLLSQFQPDAGYSVTRITFA